MKRNRQTLLAALLWAAAGGFVACSQDDDMNSYRSLEDGQSVNEGPSATRGGEPVVCSILTDEAGQVQSKVEAFVNGGGTSVVENITNLYIAGPINQTDIDYIKNLQYLDSLSLEKADVYDSENKPTNLLADESFAKMKAEAAVYLPKSINCLGACCFREANIRAIYMDEVDSLGVARIDSEYNPYNIIRYDDISDWYQTGGFQFIRCSKLETVRLSNQLTKLSPWMFAGCTSLARLELPSSVTELGRGAFLKSGLEEFSMNSVSSLEPQVFRSCSGLKTVRVSDKVVTLPPYTFKECTSLQQVLFPSSVREIEKETFMGCTSLRRIELPPNVRTIQERVFRSSGLEEFTMGDNLVDIGPSAFYDCDKLTKVVPGKSVKTIGDYAFCDCDALTEFTFPDIRELGSYVLADCDLLKTVVWPERIKTIAYGVFNGCKKLSFEIPDYITGIEGYAFFGNTFSTLTIPASVTYIDPYAFSHCNNLQSLKIGSMNGSIWSNAFSECANLEEVEIQACASIGEGCFGSCPKLKRVFIGDAGSEIGGGAFGSCKSLEVVTINQVLKIVQNAFIWCYALSDMSLPEGLETIGYDAFKGSAIRHIVIPSTVKSVGSEIFGYCPLASVQWLSKRVNVPFLGCYNPNLLLYVPEGVTVDSRHKNVITEGKAKKLVLSQSSSFHCPESFTAEEVVFQEDFSSSTWKDVATGNGVAARWNTLVLPFAVTSIASENKGALAPFGSDEVANGQAKPFWLCEMTADGWKDVVKIEANKPYLYAMPNNPNYLDEYNIQDVVSFSAKNVTIEQTPDEWTSSPTGPEGWALTPTYAAIEAQPAIYNINWKGFYDLANVWHPAGNCFRPNNRSTNAFEAYIQPLATTRASYISLGGKTTTRSTRPLGKVPQREDMLIK